MSIHFFALSMAILLLIYHQLTTLVPMFPWNDVGKYSTKELVLEAGINGVLMFIGVLSILATKKILYWYALFYYPMLFVGECVDWWIPFFSKSFAIKRKIWDYEKHFGHTLKIIPHIPGKHTPDANHIVLHIITIITIIAVYLDYFNRW